MNISDESIHQQREKLRHQIALNDAFNRLKRNPDFNLLFSAYLDTDEFQYQLLKPELQSNAVQQIVCRKNLQAWLFELESAGLDAKHYLDEVERLNVQYQQGKIDEQGNLVE